MKHPSAAIALSNFQRNPSFPKPVSPCSYAWRALINIDGERCVGKTHNLLSQILRPQGSNEGWTHAYSACSTTLKTLMTISTSFMKVYIGCCFAPSPHPQPLWGEGEYYCSHGRQTKWAIMCLSTIHTTTIYDARQTPFAHNFLGFQGCNNASWGA
jgi:hypothetical protein